MNTHQNELKQGQYSANVGQGDANSIVKGQFLSLREGQGVYLTALNSVPISVLCQQYRNKTLPEETDGISPEAFKILEAQNRLTPKQAEDSIKLSFGVGREANDAIDLVNLKKKKRFYRWEKTIQYQN